MRLRKISRRQLRLLIEIEKFIKENQYPPTQRQLSVVLHCQHGSIQELLKRLVLKGYVSRLPGIGRSIRILKGSDMVPGGAVARTAALRSKVRVPGVRMNTQFQHKRAVSQLHEESESVMHRKAV